MVQAYSFSAKPLIKALGRAHLRGVEVLAILDRAHEGDGLRCAHTSLPFERRECERGPAFAKASAGAALPGGRALLSCVRWCGGLLRQFAA